MTAAASTVATRTPDDNLPCSSYISSPEKITKKKTAEEGTSEVVGKKV